MANRVLLKIGSTDVTANILVDSYAVYNQPVYKNYEDANGITHKRYIRNKIKGTFEMFFKTLSAYSDFVTLLTTNTDSTNYSVACTVYDTYRQDLYTINAFIEFKPTITLDATFNEFMKKLSITIEER